MYIFMLVTFLVLLTQWNSRDMSFLLLDRVLTVFNTKETPVLESADVRIQAANHLSFLHPCLQLQ